jgi:hypothetical protein
MAPSETNSIQNEKHEFDAVTHVENIDRHTRMGIDHDDAVFYEDYPAEERRKILWKVRFDLRPQIPCLFTDHLPG